MCEHLMRACSYLKHPDRNSPIDYVFFPVAKPPVHKFYVVKGDLQSSVQVDIFYL